MGNNKVQLVLIGLIFKIDAIFAGTCSLATPSNLNYGVYDGTYLSPSVNGNTVLTVTCTDNNSYTFCAHLTNLPNPTDPLKDLFYVDPGRTTVMTTASCFSPNNDGNPYTARCRSGCSLPVYGNLAAGQVVAPRTTPYQSTYTIQLDVTGRATHPQVNLLAEATVNKSCYISVDNFNFNAYNPTSTSDLQIAQNALHATCNPNTSYYVTMSPGNSGNINPRQMNSGSNTLNYNFYVPSTAISCSYSTIWSTTNYWSSSGNGYQNNILICGAIFKNQFVAPGSYSDSITATINY
jgi:spore coat protein U-like protein